MPSKGNNFQAYSLILQAAGMTPMQIIVAATKNAARACNMENELGTLEAGKLADVLVVDGNPLGDIQAFNENALCCARGSRFSPHPALLWHDNRCVIDNGAK